MSSSMLNQRIARLQREVSRLENEQTSSYNKEIAALKKISRAEKSINRTKNLSTIRNKRRQIQRESQKVQKEKEKQSKILGKINQRKNNLNKALNKQREINQREQEKLKKDQEERIKSLKKEQQKQNEVLADNILDDMDDKEYDVFISHSSEDKDDYANKLAEALTSEGIEIWYDSDSIGWGQSIRQEIDRGLSYSKFGIVILSHTFISKHWTNYELDGLLSRESHEGKQILLPIWHNVTADDVREYSPSLSLRHAMNTSINTVNEIVEAVKDLVD